MGLRFRYSFGGKGYRVTISKSGVGYSVGGKGFRVTKTAKGSVRTTYSIPGTGVSYVTETSGQGKPTMGRDYAIGSGTKTSTVYFIFLIIISIFLAISVIATIYSYFSEREYERKYIETFYSYNVIYTGKYELDNAETWIQPEFIITNLSNSSKDYHITVSMYTQDDPEIFLASGKAGIMGTGFRLAAGEERKFTVKLTSPDGGRINLKAGNHTYTFRISTNVSDDGFAPPLPDELRQEN